TEGVSCESCHGGAQSWLLSHTRTDYNHADRIAAGMRELHDLRSRAQACVACHEYIDPAIVKAGHPVLTFELDGQMVTQPRHWREPADFYGPRAWLVGQAVALQELSWRLAQGEPADRDRWAALVWLLEKVSPIDENLPKWNHASA